MFDAVLERHTPARPLAGSVLLALGVHVLLIPAAFLGGKSRPRSEPAKDDVYVTFMTAPAPTPAPLPTAELAAQAAALAPGPVEPAVVRERAKSKPSSAAMLPAPTISADPAPSASAPLTVVAAPVGTAPSAGANAGSTNTGAALGGSGGGVLGGTGNSQAGALGGVAGGAPAGHATGSGVLPFGAGMTRPTLMSKVDPVYTREALAARVEGLMLVKCVITTTGTLQSCRVVKGLPHMDEAVLKALGQWRYTPVSYQGAPVSVDYVIPVRLVLP